MKQGRFPDLESFAEEIIRQAKTKLDIPAKADSLHMTDANTLVHVNGGAKSFAMSRLGHEQLANRLDIPKKFYDTMLADYPELLVHNVNYLMPKVSEGYWVRTLDGKVRAVLSPRFKLIDNAPALSCIINPLRDAGFQLVSAEVTDYLMHFKVISPRLTAEIKKGDVVQAGFYFRNSEVGHSRFSGSLFFNRLVCLNGMILGKEYGFSKNHAGKAIDFDAVLESHYSAQTLADDNKVFLAKMTDVVRGLVCSEEGFKAAVKRFADAAEQKVTGDPNKALETLAAQLTLSQEEQGGVLRKLIEGGDLSRWGMANALTAYSQEVVDYDRATDFEAFGGKVIELPNTQWEQIAKAA